MKLIVISSPTKTRINEGSLITELFSLGLKYLHIRKPGWEQGQVEELLQNIPEVFYPNISLHSHIGLVEPYGLGGVHLTEKKRKETPQEQVDQWKAEGKRVSTSIHAREQLRTLKKGFHYVFVSPVFDSIAKKGLVAEPEWQRPIVSPHTCIALGGMDVSKIGKVREWGYGGIAVLGGVWEEPHKALDNFTKLNAACTRNSNTLARQARS